MVFHEYGKDREKVLVLLHSAADGWELFREAVRKLEETFHIYVPALPGFDRDQPQSDFPGVREAAEQVTDALMQRGVERLEGLYGLGLGGSIAMCMLDMQKLPVHQAIVESAPLPMQSPEIITRLAGKMDMLMVQLRRKLAFGGKGRIISTRAMTEKENARLKANLEHVSDTTLQHAIAQGRSYTLSGDLAADRAAYWVGSREKVSMEKDIRFIEETYPSMVIRTLYPMDTGDLVSRHPDKFARFLTDSILRDDM